MAEADNGTVMRCKRCKREARPWLLDHKACSPKDWVYCITTDPERIEVARA